MDSSTTSGFTVIELMLVMVITGILLMVSLPAYQEQVRKTTRSLARAELLEAVVRQEQFFLDHRRYAGLLTELGYPASPYAIDSNGNDQPAASPDGIYLIELSTSGASFTLRAVPQSQQAADRLCGTLELTSSGFKAATGGGSTSECW